MKIVFLVFSLIGTTFAVHGNASNDLAWIEKTPGCEDVLAVQHINVRECCLDLPEVVTKEIWKACAISCKSSTMGCCQNDCIMKGINLLDDSGSFNSDRAKDSLKKALHGNITWPIEAIVDDCGKSAAEDIKNWQGTVSNEEDKKLDITTCPNPQNMAISRCIRRALTLKCPDWTKNDRCDKMLAFANGCPRYPLPEKSLITADNSDKA